MRSDTVDVAIVVEDESEILVDKLVAPAFPELNAGVVRIMGALLTELEAAS
jgi:hypothetical protein